MKTSATYNKVLGVILFLAFCSFNSKGGVRLEERISFTQPDGTVLELRGEGNEYRAVFETLDGYTVVFVPEERAYYYAALGEDGAELVSSGVLASPAAPENLGLEPGLRIQREAARAQARERRQQWESRTQLPERWARLKASASTKGDLQSMSLLYRNTIGTKCGLTLLVDFDGTPGPVARSNIVEFMNGDNFRGNGNQGSIKEYYAAVSGGKLTYTNLVIGYIRIPRSVQPRSYYNDLNRTTWFPGNELIRDAIRVMTNQPNYMTEIVPQLEALSVNYKGEVVALNVYVAGPNSGVWSKGLWAHSDALSTYVGPQELWPGGTKVNNYQMTMLADASALNIGVFCHETGHLLCDFPDIYDYDNTSGGGAGNFCLMDGNAGYGGNPQHVNGYLKLVAGWVGVTDIIPGPATTFTLDAAGTGEGRVLRYRPYPFSREYFVIENRAKTGRDTIIPGGGILVWHIDELGNNSNENLLPNSLHANYEVTLAQADGRWDLQNAVNAGDSTDPFYSGNRAARYQNRFADDTTPGAIWWNGSRSGLELRDFSTVSNRMTLVAEVKPPRIVRDPMSQMVAPLDDLYLSVQMATNQAYTYRWFKGGAPLDASDRITGVDGPGLGVYGMTSADAGAYHVVIGDSAGHSETSRVAQVSLSTLPRLAVQDVGDASRMSGQNAILDNAYQISAAGSGLVGAADSCRFLYQSLSGDFDARLQVIEMGFEQGEGFWQLISRHRGGVGLTVRASLDAGSAQASVMVRQREYLENAALQVLARTGRGATIGEMARIGEILPRDNWVRLRREGSLVSMYYSTNGSRWDWLETVSLPLASEALIGISASSYDPVTRITAGVKSYRILTNVPATFAISAVKNSAQEGTGDRATLAVVSSRQGPLEIPYTLRDSSGNGVLYETLGGILNLPAGTNVAFINIDPINNVEAARPHVVSVTLSGSGVSQSQAHAVIFDDEDPGQGLLKELYPGITGTAVSDLTGHFQYPGMAQLSTVSNFESEIVQQAGQVLSGYISPPTTGAYTFYLASANAAELWLSSDHQPRNSVLIAAEFGTNTKRNWPGYGPMSHISAPVALRQGSWYFLKAIHKAGLGTRHLAVAWKLPDGPEPVPGGAPIPGEFLRWALPKGAPAGGATLRIAISPEGKLLLHIENANQASFILEGSNDLVNWQVVSNNLALGEFDLLNLDTSANLQSARFYRVIGR